MDNNKNTKTHIQENNMNKNLISWLEGLSSSMEVAVRAYCELRGECSVAIYQIVLEQVIFTDVVKSFTKK
jgi:hypothetical protein